MGVDRDDRIGSEHYTDSAPNYDVFSREAKTSVGVAALLVGGTLALMWLARGTVLADLTLFLYMDAPTAPLPGVLVFGAVLTVGRSVGISAAVEEKHGLALAASALVAIGYAVFGAGVLALYPTAIHADALAVTLVLTALVTVGAAKLVYTTGRDFSNWDAYSGICMLVGALVFVFGSYVAPAARYLGFGIVLLGWLADLVYEIYMVSDANRSPLANGIGVYVAFMGVFVHLLQLVLEAMAEGE